MAHQPPISPADITRLVAFALEEDVGSGDITAQLIPIDKTSKAAVITREPCVVCGRPWFDEVFRQLDGSLSLDWQVAEGDDVDGETTLVTLHGNARHLLTGERTALNFLQLLSGTATKAREFARLVECTHIKVLDTRKTVPGLRSAQKYAVSVGGCHNHRIGLYDAFLIKENHIAACGGIGPAIEYALALHPDKPIIVEVESFTEYREAIAYPISRVMLDNFSPEDYQKVARHERPVPIEVSGNIDAEQINQLVDAGIDAISSGALTKHVQAIDLSMRIAL